MVAWLFPVSNGEQVGVKSAYLQRFVFECSAAQHCLFGVDSRGERNHKRWHISIQFVLGHLAKVLHAKKYTNRQVIFNMYTRFSNAFPKSTLP